MSRSVAIAFSLGALLGFSSQAGAQAGAAATQSAKQPAPVTTANVPAPGSSVDWGRAEGIVEGSLSDVLAVLHDYGQYAGLFPHFEKSRVLSQRGTDAIVYLEAKILHGAATLWGQVRMSSTQPRPGFYVVEAKLMKGKGNMSELLAKWEVLPLEGGARTKVAFQLLVDPDLPFPDSMVSAEMKSTAGWAFRSLRKRVSQRAAYVQRSSKQL